MLDLSIFILCLYTFNILNAMKYSQLDPIYRQRFEHARAQVQAIKTGWNNTAPFWVPQVEIRCSEPLITATAHSIRNDVYAISNSRKRKPTIYNSFVQHLPQVEQETARIRAGVTGARKYSLIFTFLAKKESIERALTHATCVSFSSCCRGRGDRGPVATGQRSGW